MMPETLIAMLACARIGAVHSVVFGGFASHELAMRIEDAAPKRSSCPLPAGSRSAGRAIQAAARSRASRWPRTSRAAA